MMQDTRRTYVTISELAARSGESVPCASNHPVKLDDPDSVWFIENGTVNLFLVEAKDGVETAAPQNVLCRESGWLLPGVAPDEQRDGTDTKLSLVAKGSPGTLLRRLPASSLAEVRPSELADQIDAWLIAITDTLSRFAGRIPRPTAIATPGQSQTLATGTLSVRRGVVWVSAPPCGVGLYMDIVDTADFDEAAGTDGALTPLTRTSWLTMFDSAALAGKSTAELARQGTLLPDLARFHKVAFVLERFNRRLAVADDANLEQAMTRSRRAAEVAARQRLFNVYDLPVDQDFGVEETALADALQVIGRREGIDFKVPKRYGPSDSPIGLVDILDASGVHARRVRLRREDRWWRGDSNALLAFRAEDGGPVVLLPGLFGNYRQIEPDRQRSVRITADRANALMDEAWMFYRPLPPENVKPADLVSIALQGSSADIARLVFAGLPGGLIKLLPALGLGFVATQAEAGGNAGALHALAVALAVFGLLGAMLHLLQSKAMMRLEGRSATRLEAAFWDRLMRLPPTVLHRRSAGDLATSGMTFQNLRNGIQWAAADSLLSFIFLLPVLGLIFFYDATLGMIALVFGLASLLCILILGLCQISPYRQMIRASRHVAGRLFQIVGGIASLRVDAAEGSAFAIWAQDYREQKQAELKLNNLEGHTHAFSAALPFLAGGVLLFAAATGDQSLGINGFLIVFLVFMTFQSAIARLGESFGAIAAALPAFEQMRPLLAAVPKGEAEGEPVEFLGGDILFDRVSFRYDEGGPLILDDVSIHARPGEFVAIVGASGSGKSTLFRLALGIDQPIAGAVYYDGRDLRHLNVKQVRRMIGAVPQSVALHPDDLWDNLVGHHEGLEVKEVWKAIRSAELEDEVRGMPMGLMTMVGTSGSVLSGGERQRVMISRSVIGSPRVMLFDEATNWLDNENQANVMQNLAAITSTRLVIAHRLSTLERADRIYVLQAGRVVQTGSFNELVEVDGVFRELVKRQIA